MSEKNYTKLRQRLGYKPSYKNRRYKIWDRIINFFKFGKKKSMTKKQYTNTGHRQAYRAEKKTARETGRWD